MKTVILFLSLLPLTFAHASLSVSDKENLASVNLHTELIESTKRVYLAVDFEAKHKEGLIACELLVTHKNGKEKGESYKLIKDTSLLPGEKIPFNLGLFPESFHASGLDVKAELKCRPITYFLNQKNKNKLLKASLSEPKACCKMSEFKIVCYTQPDGGVEVKPAPVEFEPVNKNLNSVPSCFPEKE